MKSSPAMFLVAALLGSLTANAEVCGSPLESEASSKLNVISSNDCDVYWSDTLPVSGTVASIHVDKSIDDLPPDFTARVLEGLQDADGALVKLGPDVLVGRNKPVGRAVRVIVTPVEDATSLAWEEMNSVGCFLIIDPKSWRSVEGRRDLLITMAHEFFHCLQDATFSRRLLSAGTGSGDDAIYNDWWIEGSAEWFGILAQPEHERQMLTRDFELHTDHLALPHFERSDVTGGGDAHASSTWPFFAWYSEHFSAHAVIPFLEDLPRQLHSPANIVRKLDHEKWGDFATRYAAFTIWMDGLGLVIPDDRDTHPLHRLDEGVHAFERPTGQMIRERAQLEPGKWAIKSTVSPNTGRMYFSRIKGNGDPDGSWLELDRRREVQSVCGEPLDLMFAGFGSDPDAKQFKFTVERIDDTCDVRCDSVPAQRNSCVVGTWVDIGFTPDSAIRRMAPGVVEHRYPLPTYSFGSDGRFSVNHPFYMYKNLDGPPGIDYFQITHYTLNANYGYWGSESGSLATCEQQQVSRGVQVTGFDRQQAGVPLNWDKPIDPVRETQFTFSCNEDTLELKSDVMGPATLTLERVPDQP